jgi:peptidoglycan hydrolase CwlO-like protein
MLQPVVTTLTENTIHLNKHQVDLDTLADRVKQLEVVFNGGRGKNYIYDKLTNRISEEMAERVALSKDMAANLDAMKLKVAEVFKEIDDSEYKFKNFQEEMIQFKKELDEYYAFILKES